MAIRRLMVLGCDVWRPSICRSYAKKARSILSEDESSLIDLDKLADKMSSALKALEWEYTNTVINRITPAMLDKVMVQVDGRDVPLKHLGQISVRSRDAQSLLVDLSSNPEVLQEVVKSVENTLEKASPKLVSNNMVEITIPRMTGEFRDSLVKLAKQHAEKTKSNVRRVRSKGVSEAKAMKSVSKDSVKRLEKHIQQITDNHIDSIDKLLKAKTTELLK